jgi:hypothetical protein
MGCVDFDGNHPLRRAAHETNETIDDITRKNGAGKQTIIEESFAESFLAPKLFPSPEYL